MSILGLDLLVNPAVYGQWCSRQHATACWVPKWSRICIFGVRVSTSDSMGSYAADVLGRAPIKSSTPVQPMDLPRKRLDHGPGYGRATARPAARTRRDECWWLVGAACRGRAHWNAHRARGCPPRTPFVCQNRPTPRTSCSKLPLAPATMAIRAPKTAHISYGLEAVRAQACAAFYHIVCHATLPSAAPPKHLISADGPGLTAAQ